MPTPESGMPVVISTSCTPIYIIGAGAAVKGDAELVGLVLSTTSVQHADHRHISGDNNALGIEMKEHRIRYNSI